MKFYVPEIQVTEKGQHYFAALCPDSGKTLFIEEDPSKGSKRLAPGEVLASCHHCQKPHRFDSSEISSLLQTEGE